MTAAGDTAHLGATEDSHRRTGRRRSRPWWRRRSRSRRPYPPRARSAPSPRRHRHSMSAGLDSPRAHWQTVRRSWGWSRTGTRSRLAPDCTQPVDRESSCAIAAPRSDGAAPERQSGSDDRDPGRSRGEPFPPGSFPWAGTVSDFCSIPTIAKMATITLTTTTATPAKTSGATQRCRWSCLAIASSNEAREWSVLVMQVPPSVEGRRSSRLGVRVVQFG